MGEKESVREAFGDIVVGAIKIIGFFLAIVLFFRCCNGCDHGLNYGVKGYFEYIWHGNNVTNTQQKYKK